MKTIALKPPKPELTAPRKPSTVTLCTSCDKPLNETEECAGCTKVSHTFRAIWPVLVPITAQNRAELLTEAAQDLHHVALRHRAHITGPGKGYIASGRGMPGANGAAHVVVIEAPAEPIQRPYHR